MFIFNTAFCDVAYQYQMGFQDPATSTAEAMIFFHNYVCFFLVVIISVVCWFLIKIIFSFDKKNNVSPTIFTHSSLLEIIWTIIPAIILVLIAVPSFGLLYSMEDVPTPQYTIKIVGHQWYWTYEYGHTTGGKRNKMSYDSYLNVISSKQLQASQFLPLPDKYLGVDLCCRIPLKTHVRLIVTSADVLHSWAVPSLGIKVDACPGRLTQAFVYIKRPGLFVGQCSEICGIKHAFMPIGVRVNSDHLTKTFLSVWNSDRIDELLY